MMPVPPGTARHQLSSVAPTARDFVSADSDIVVSFFGDGIGF